MTNVGEPKMDLYKHRGVFFLVVMMLVFAAAFFVSYSFYKSGKAILDVGLNAITIDWLVMVLSIVAIARIVFLIKDIEIGIGHSN